MQTSSDLKEVVHGNGATLVNSKDYSLRKVIGIEIEGIRLQEVPNMTKDEEHEFEMELVKEFHARIRRLFLDLNNQ